MFNNRHQIPVTRFILGIVFLFFTRQLLFAQKDTITDNVSYVLRQFDPGKDSLSFSGIDSFPDNEFAVYDRWGQLVFYASPYRNDWDGTTVSTYYKQDEVLPEGIYFYALRLKNRTSVIKGCFRLVAR